jgi:hypothetical protein
LYQVRQRTSKTAGQGTLRMRPASNSLQLLAMAGGMFSFAQEARQTSQRRLGPMPFVARS